ncbi:MAG: hypothetical protein ACK5MG_05430 [Bacteroidales bacterium]
MKNLILTILLATTILTGYSQDKRKHDWDKFKAIKVSFITEKVELTPEEAQKFWPVYNKYESQKFELMKVKRKGEEAMCGEISESEAKTKNAEYIQCMEKEAEIARNMNADLLKVISAKKVMRLYRAEFEFRDKIIRDFRDHNHNRDREMERRD